MLRKRLTPFKDKVEKYCRVRDLLHSVTSSTLPRCAHVNATSVPTLSDLGFDETMIAQVCPTADLRSVMTFTGGEDAALQRLQQWMFVEDKLKEYFDIRNGMLGSEYSSKLSPALALGCISARKIFWEVRRYEETRQLSNKSTYWLIWELTCRDFFRCICAKYDRRIFYRGGAIGAKVHWRNDIDTIRKWKAGLTGYPLVDANMRELALTGWMSNRGRQIVASYLVLDCGIDWRVGADHFESLLLDHDVCSNYGNWNAAAGLLGGRINRFNITKQSRDYDAEGAYIRHWLPELRPVPAPTIFEPWKMNQHEQAQYHAKIGSGVDCVYPSPLSMPLSSLMIGKTSKGSSGVHSRGGRRPKKKGI